VPLNVISTGICFLTSNDSRRIYLRLEINSEKMQSLLYNKRTLIDASVPKLVVEVFYCRQFATG
jgi:hypothetical protein